MLLDLLSDLEKRKDLTTIQGTEAAAVEVLPELLDLTHSARIIFLPRATKLPE